MLELALREALSLGHDYIGTEHILLGLVRENEGVAAHILLDFDADAEKIRNQVIRMLSGPGRRSGSSGGGDANARNRADSLSHWRARALSRSQTRRRARSSMTTSAPSTSCSGCCARKKGSRGDCCAPWA